MGIEFRESSLVIGPKTHAVAQKGMVFNLNVGIANLENPDSTEKGGKVYALFIGDTVLVNEVSLLTFLPTGHSSCVCWLQGAPATVFTNSKKKIKNVGIFLKDEDEVEEEEEEEKSSSAKPAIDLGRGKRTAVLDSKLRVSPPRQHMQ
jgi:nucleosome binding factor SPN SPT16 subunit